MKNDPETSLALLSASPDAKRKKAQATEGKGTSQLLTIYNVPGNIWTFYVLHVVSFNPDTMHGVCDYTCFRVRPRRATKAKRSPEHVEVVNGKARS